MANEGEFPKSDGDILFASEVNDFKGFGDGTDGAYSDSGNLNQGTVFQYSSFTLTNGNTLTTTSTSGKPIYVYVQGDCTIGGTIDLDGKGYDFGAGSTGDGADGENFVRDDDYGTSAKGGSRSAGTGGNGGIAGLSSFQKFNATLNAINIDSSQGGAAGSGNNASTVSGGDGGNGGGTIIFIVGGDFTFSGTGIITCAGTDGTNGANGGGDGGAGGGGGGGGGSIWVLYFGTLTDSGSTTVTAGSGGVGGSGSNSPGGGGGGGGGSIKTSGSNGNNQSSNNGGNGGAGGAGTKLFEQIKNQISVTSTSTI